MLAVVNKKYILFCIIFIAGITNDVLCVHIGKKMSPIELSLYAIFFMMVFYGKFYVSKVPYYMLALSGAFFFSTVMNINSLPASNYILAPSVYTNYSTRSLFVSLQFFMLTLTIVGFRTFLYRMHIKAKDVVDIVIKATTLFALLGIFFYFLNILGVDVSLIQSNEKSYGRYRLYSFAVEPQYAALFMTFGLFTSFFEKDYGKFIIIALATLLTFSTGVLLGIFSAMVFYYFYKRFTLKKVLAGLCFMIAFSYFAQAFIIPKIIGTFSVLQGNASVNVEARASSILQGVELFKDNWLKGVGWGNFSFYYTFRGEEKIVNLSNIFLRVWLEGGLLSFVILLSFVFYLYKILRRMPVQYSLICIVYLVYFMPNSTAFLQPYFWIFIILIESLYNSNKFNNYA